MTEQRLSADTAPLMGAIYTEKESAKPLHDMTDEELAMRYINGDNSAFDLLLDRNKTKLFSYILFVVRNRDVADDLFQDTFVKIIVKLQNGEYTPSGKFGAWMTRIAHNIIMDWFRNQTNGQIVDVDETNDMTRIEGDSITDAPVEAAYINEQVLSDVKHLMDQLPATQREVVFMRYFQNLSFKEIADTTGVSINTSLGRMRYAVINLRRMVKSNDIALQLA